MVTSVVSSEAELIRLPVDRLAKDVSMSRLTLDAAALSAAFLVAIASADKLYPRCRPQVHGRCVLVKSLSTLPKAFCPAR